MRTFRSCLLLCLAQLLAALAVTSTGCSNGGDDWLAELNDPSPVRRAGGVRVLWKKGDDHAYALANKALADRSSIVRVAAVRALADFKTRDTTIALVRAARDADPEVRFVAVEELSQRQAPEAGKALLDILVRGEPNLKVRRRLKAALEKRGLSGAQLADKLASEQIVRIRKLYADALPVQRARLVSEAGNSASPEGLGIVLDALFASDAAVTLAAVSVLDGRGGEKALKRLIALAADDSDEVRLAAVRALGSFGNQGAAIIEGALRDVDSEIRIEALARLAASGARIDAGTVCPLLREADLKDAVEIARLLRSKATDCPLTEFGDELKKPGSDGCRRALKILAALGSNAAREVLRRAMKKSSGAPKIARAVALARAGGKDAGLGRMLEAALVGAIGKLEAASHSWVHGKLRPGKKEAASVVDKNRLSEEDLQKLMKDHGLEPPGPGTPRGVTDILAKYADDSAGVSESKLFSPGGGRECSLLADSLDGLFLVDPVRAGRLAPRCLGFSQPQIVGRVAAVLSARGYKLDLEAGIIRHMADLLDRSDNDSAAAIAGLLGDSGKPEAAQAIAAALAGAGFEKREKLIAVLGRMRKKSVIPSLLPLLNGYSAGSAARALAQIGDRTAVEPLRKALKNVGLSAEFDLLMAMAVLGATDITTNLDAKIEDRDPLVRLAAVRIIAAMGEPYLHEHLAQAQYDPDRRVRREAELSMRAAGGNKNNSSGDR